MLGYSVRMLQNGYGSPRSVGSPSANAGVDSPKTDAAEIDTRAPFESVKAAVSLFGDVISPKSRPVVKKTKAEELQAKLVEKETQHLMIIKELEKYKDRLKTVESAKAEAQRDLKRANKTLQELTTKLETLSESKQAAIAATEAAKCRARELEQQQARLGSDAWKQDLDRERERFKAYSGDLIATKQELASLRQDFDAALLTKLAAFQAIEEAQQSFKTHQEKQAVLERQIGMMQQTLDQVKFESLHAHEEHLRVVAEKEVHLLVHKSARDSAEKEMKILREDHRKLEETSEAIKVIQEQLNDVRASDMNALETVGLELERANKELEKVVKEENELRAYVDSLKMDINRTKREFLECETRVLDIESRIRKIQDDLEKMKGELAASITTNASDELQASLEKLLADAEKDRHEAEELHHKIELLRREVETFRVAAKEAGEKLEIAQTEAEEAKAAEKLAGDQIHETPRIDDPRKIRLSVDEFKMMNQKVEECRREADTKVGGLMGDLQKIKTSECEVLKKVEMMLNESENMQLEIMEALKRAEMAEAEKKEMENQMCREEEISWKFSEDENKYL